MKACKLAWQEDAVNYELVVNYSTTAIATMQQLATSMATMATVHFFLYFLSIEFHDLELDWQRKQTTSQTLKQILRGKVSSVAMP